MGVSLFLMPFYPTNKRKCYKDNIFGSYMMQDAMRHKIHRLILSAFE